MLDNLLDIFFKYMLNYMKKYSELCHLFKRYHFSFKSYNIASCNYYRFKNTNGVEIKLTITMLVEDRTWNNESVLDPNFHPKFYEINFKSLLHQF